MKIEIGEVVYLDMDVVEEAPYPDIYIGRARRRDPGPPTTEALARALAVWRAEQQGAAD